MATRAMKNIFGGMTYMVMSSYIIDMRYTFRFDAELNNGQQTFKDIDVENF